MKYIKTFESFINEGYLFENYDTVSIINDIEELVGAILHNGNKQAKQDLEKLSKNYKEKGSSRKSEWYYKDEIKDLEAIRTNLKKIINNNNIKNPEFDEYVYIYKNQKLNTKARFKKLNKSFVGNDRKAVGKNVKLHDNGSIFFVGEYTEAGKEKGLWLFYDEDSDLILRKSSSSFFSGYYKNGEKLKRFNDCTNEELKTILTSDWEDFLKDIPHAYSQISETINNRIKRRRN
jgi:hypothetical protein